MAAKPHRIDVHHHMVPVEYTAALARVGVAEAARVPFPKWDVESSLAFMNRKSIAAAIVSISSPGIYFGDNVFAQKMARRCNKLSARIVSEHPLRFGAFAVLPVPDMEASVLELEYALDTLKLDGVGLLSNYNGQYLGDPAFTDLYSELNRRKTVVFVHPNTLPDDMLPKTKVTPAIMEFVFDTTRCVANLIYSRTLRRYPDIRFIFPHAGGAVPFLTWRISMGERGIIKQLKRLYYDIALSATPYALRSLQELADPSHILFGSDYPFLPEPLITTMAEGVETYDGFDAQTRMAIERDNALDLFPRFKSS
ncbi:MAG: amidohydrolase [Candidatus Helarchaeota archaeon]|nr:amidohydrolase [Candidatus Helarchaeota archaeon]